MARTRFFKFSVVFGLLIVAGTGLFVYYSSRCPVEKDTVPFQYIWGAQRSDVTTLSTADIYSPIPRQRHFYFFIKSATGHLEAKMAKKKLCLDNPESKKSSLIQFVYLGIQAGTDNLDSLPPIEARTNAVCRISSPWLELIVEREPVPAVRGVVRWSARQRLADEALLAGMGNVPLGVARPLLPKEFSRYADLEYAPSEIFGQPSEKPIEERVPGDLLWLFNNAKLFRDDQKLSKFSYTAGGSSGVLMGAGAAGYTKLVIKLIDRCFETEGADIQINSILDIDDPALIEQYKIDNPINAIAEKAGPD